MTYDLIIVAKSTSPELINITTNCINSARAECDLNVIVVETAPIQLMYNYDVDKIVHYEGPFNYNRALNQGLQYTKSDIHILANNDLIFHTGWSKIGDLMIQYGFASASVLSQDPRQRAFDRGDYIYEGYHIGVHLTGWLIFVLKETIQIIGPLDETYQFWYSDNAYAYQLKAHGLKHGLFCNIRVDHLGSKTLKTLPIRDQRKYSVNTKYHAK